MIRLLLFAKKIKFFILEVLKKNVLSRYYKTAVKFKLKKNIVRLTSDCPLIDINTLEKMIKNYKKFKVDFYSNTVPHPCKFPDGSDIEIFSFKTLKKAFKKFYFTF